MESEKIMGYLIPGGARLRMDDLRKLAQTPGFEEFVGMLKEYPYWSDIADAVEAYRETKSLNAVEIAFADYCYLHQITSWLLIVSSLRCISLPRAMVRRLLISTFLLIA
jgi:vacuolar-type H+-ATPase subunit C/Vma6